MSYLKDVSNRIDPLMSQKPSETQRHNENLNRKSLGFTRYLDTVSCPEQTVFLDRQAFRGDPFNPTYIVHIFIIQFTLNNAINLLTDTNSAV